MSYVPLVVGYETPFDLEVKNEVAYPVLDVFFKQILIESKNIGHLIPKTHIGQVIKLIKLINSMYETTLTTEFSDVSYVINKKEAIPWEAMINKSIGEPF